MQNSIPEDDWVTAEAEALMDSDPQLRADLHQQVLKAQTGTLETVDTATLERHLREARDARLESRSRGADE